MFGGGIEIAKTNLFEMDISRFFHLFEDRNSTLSLLSHFKVLFKVHFISA